MVLLFVTTTMELGDRLLIFVCIICPQWEITHTVCFSWVANESAKRNQDLAALSASVKKCNRKLKPSYRFYYVILPVDQMRISHHSGSLWIILGSLLASFKCFSLSCHKYWINILIIETRSLACPVRIYIYIKYWYVWYHPKWMFPKMGCAHGFGILHVKKRQTRHTFTEFKETTNFPVLARSIRALPYSIPNCSRGYPRLELQPWNTDLIQSVWWYYIYIYVWAIWQRNQPYSIKPYNSKPYNSISIWLPCIIILTHIV